MKYTDDINIFKLNKDFTAEIDITGTFGHIYHYPQRMNGCLFILCLRGECDIGVTKVARIILKRFTNAGAWEDYWQKRMQIIGNVVIGVGNYKCVSQNLGQ